jgi:hypothetical protein
MPYWAYATEEPSIIVAMASLRANMVFSGFQEKGAVEDEATRRQGQGRC